MVNTFFMAGTPLLELLSPAPRRPAAGPSAERPPTRSAVRARAAAAFLVGQAAGLPSTGKPAACPTRTTRCRAARPPGRRGRATKDRRCRHVGPPAGVLGVEPSGYLSSASATLFIGRRPPQHEKTATTWGGSAASPSCALPSPCPGCPAESVSANALSWGACRGYLG